MRLIDADALTADLYDAKNTTLLWHRSNYARRT